MAELTSLVSVLLGVLCLCLTGNGSYVKYNTGAGVVPGKINVHLVQYYVGSNSSFQVNDANLVVQDSSGNTVDTHLDNVTINFYTKAYLGHSSKQIPRYWLIFPASVAPLGWNTSFLKQLGKVRGKYYLSINQLGAGASHEVLDNGSVLLRLAHLYEIKKLKETSLEKFGDEEDEMES